jgi:uncharacterized phiE125 gp8 family phage protein
MAELILTSAPAAAVLSLAGAKLQLGLTGTDGDSLLTDLIAQEAGRLDGRDGVLDRALISQDWRLWMPRVPDSPLVWLPLAPLQAVTEIGYVDPDGDAQVFPTSDYRVLDGDPGAVELVSTAVWPATDVRHRAFYIDFTAGYGDAADDVPGPIRAALVLMVREAWHAVSRDPGLASATIPGVFSWQAARGGSPALARAESLLAPFRRAVLR